MDQLFRSRCVLENLVSRLGLDHHTLVKVSLRKNPLAWRLQEEITHFKLSGEGVLIICQPGDFSS